MNYSKINTLLKKFCKKANSSGALNYCVNMEVFPALNSAGESAKNILDAALKRK